MLLTRLSPIVEATMSNGTPLSPRGRGIDYIVNPETGCWEWAKRRCAKGYGTGSFLAAGIETQHAHRAYWIAANGPLPEGYVIDHLCRNHPCVNPEHLEAVPPHLNVHRGDQAKLTMDDAREIRRCIIAGELMSPIAERYGVSVHTIHWIAEDIMWREDYDAPRRPVRPAGVTCPECGVEITHGKRNKKFCCARHRDRFNDRARYQRLRKAA